MTAPSALAREAAAQLWERFAGAPAGAAQAAAVARLHTALRVELQRWIGADGYRVLYTRAHELSRAAHPEIAVLTPGTQEPSIGALTLVAGNGVQLSVAIQTLLANIVDLLAKIVGFDVAVRLVDQVVVQDRREGPDTTSDGARDGQ